MPLHSSETLELINRLTEEAKCKSSYLSELRLTREEWFKIDQAVRTLLAYTQEQARKDSVALRALYRAGLLQDTDL